MQRPAEPWLQTRDPPTGENRWAGERSRNDVMDCLLHQQTPRFFIFHGGAEIKWINTNSPSTALANSAETMTKLYWEIIADNLSKAGWSLGCVSAIDREERTII
jgi:hypothetical protein